MIDPISLGMAVYGLFKGPMLVGSFLMTRQFRKATKTTLNGIVTDVEVVRRNIAEMASDISTDFADLNARVDILVDATNALQEATRRFDAKLDLLLEASFKKGWEQLKLAAGASSESRCERLLERAEDAFVDSYSLLKNERLITARYGAALAQVQLGELTNALATLEEVASIPFDASAPNSDYWTFLQMKLEMRDYLATLGSHPKLADYWRERTARFYKLAESARSEEAGMQAYRLARATQLLSSDLKAGAEALKSASRGVDETLNAEGAEVYEKTFGEEFVAVEAEPQAGTRKVLTIKGVDFAFRYCPSGTFMMGSPSSEAGRSDDETQHEVTLTKGFWMLETSVTQGMYRAITGSNPSYFESGDNYPVERVSWFDSQSFCESLNALGVAPAGFAFRLPTEAEWEYACRAGTNTPYFWGSTLNGDKANCDGNSPYGGVSEGRYLEKTSAVGSYTPNGWGLYDMHGNVYDWCADWLGDYGSGPQTDPMGPTSGSDRVLRGGGWSHGAKYCRSANRDVHGPTYRSLSLGFRLVLGR
ncbi:MAG: formylglycine-generating enzyme family protein [Thermoguttaceae bacterium]|nr:formylglycine-generating enzyme family protein [Thermoguttaceae bacterium]